LGSKTGVPSLAGTEKFHLKSKRGPSIVGGCPLREEGGKQVEEGGNRKGGTIHSGIKRWGGGGIGGKQIKGSEKTWQGKMDRRRP